MKAIVCEMCSSHDVVKQDGFYICQSCGTKYSTEEARKLMVEIQGKVDVTGSTVKVDTADVISRSLANARRAMQKEDWEETEKYYDLVEQNDPSNIEAIFYSAYAKAKTTLISDDIFRREAVFKTFTKSISIIDDNFDINREEVLRPMVKQMITDTIRMCSSDFVVTVKKNEYGTVTTSNAEKTYLLFAEIKAQLIESIINIGKKLNEAENDAALLYYSDAKALLNCFRPNEKNSMKNWTGFRCNQLLDVAEGMAGLDNKGALDTAKGAVQEYENTTQYRMTESQAKGYKMFSERALRLIAKLDPTVNMAAELERAENIAAEGVRKERNANNIRTFVILGIVVSTIIGLVVLLCFALG